MSSGDFRINAQVRQILVRHWLEIEALSANAINGVLYVKGTIQYRPAKRAQVGDITPEFLQKLECELKLIKDLKKIRWQLENWERNEGDWLPLGQQGQRGKRPPSGPGTGEKRSLTDLPTSRDF